MASGSFCALSRLDCSGGEALLFDKHSNGFFAGHWESAFQFGAFEVRFKIEIKPEFLLRFHREEKGSVLNITAVQISCYWTVPCAFLLMVPQCSFEI
jgi:hypothetical protein